MILEGLFSFIGNIYLGIIGLINIPFMPNDVLESAKNFLELLFSNASLLGLFVRISTLKTIATIFLAILAFKVALKIFSLYRFLRRSI